MCLESIKKRVDNPTGIVLSGWKEFNGDVVTPHFQNMSFNGKSEVPLDEWIEAQRVKLGSFTTKYQSGFHIYSDEKEISGQHRYNRYRRVYYRQVEVIGEQNGKAVVVARWMYVPSDPDAWPPLRS